MPQDPRYQPGAVTLTDQEAARRLLRATDAQRGFRLDEITRQELEMLARGRRPTLAFDEEGGSSMPVSALEREPEPQGEGRTLSQLAEGSTGPSEPRTTPTAPLDRLEWLAQEDIPSPAGMGPQGGVTLEALTRPMARPPSPPPSPLPQLEPPETRPMARPPTRPPSPLPQPSPLPSPLPQLEPPETRPMARPPSLPPQPQPSPSPPPSPPPQPRTGPFMHYDPSQIPLRSQAQSSPPQPRTGPFMHYDPSQIPLRPPAQSSPPQPLPPSMWPGLLSNDPGKPKPYLQPYRPPPAPPRPGELPDLPEEGLRPRMWREVKDVGKDVIATGIDVVFEAGGAALGAATKIPGAPVVGASVSSLAANKLNKALGLREGGPEVVGGLDVGDIVSAGGPVVSRAVQPAVRAGVRNLPGAQLAMHEDVATRLGTWTGNVAPAEPADAIWGRLRAGPNPLINTTNVWRDAHDILQKQLTLEPEVRNERLVKMTQAMIRLSGQNGARVPLANLDDHRKELGQILADVRAGTQHRNEAEYSRLYGAIHRDYEGAVAKGIPEAAEVKAALQAGRREHGHEEVVGFFREGGPGISRRADGTVEVNGGKLRTRFEERMRTDPVLRDSLTPAEHAEIRQIFTQAEQLRRLGPLSGAQYGSGRTLGRMAIAAAVSPIIGVSPATGAAVMAGAEQLMAHGLTTEWGKAIVRRSLKQGHQLMSREMLALLRSGLQKELGLSEVPQEQARAGAGAGELPDLPD